MMTIPDPRRAIVRWGLAAIAIFALSAAPGERAEALSLINPGAAPAAKHVSDGSTIDVRGGHGGGFRGGGFHGGGFRGGRAAFHGGGFRGGRAVFRGGGYRAGHVFRGGGYRYGRHHYRGYGFTHRRHFHSRFYGYGTSYYYRHRYCRVIWTHYGPRKICRYRPWYHHHWRHRGLRFQL
jgi:hypothetical protein